MKRLQLFRESLKKRKIDGMVITNPENRHYLSGFTGSAGVLLISETEAILVCDFRYWEQAAAEAPDFTIKKQSGELEQGVVSQICDLGWRSVGFEPESLSFREYQNYRGLLPETIEWLPIPDLLKTQRAKKEPGEIEILAQAACITDLAWEKTMAILRPGIRELEIALEFDYQLRKHGAEGTAFPTIVASGWRTSMPHAMATEKQVASGELVLLDGGAKYRGYHADMTRTVVVGKASPKQQEIYRIVLEAQKKALESIQAGLPGKVVDAVARDYIANEGYGECFGHGLGHSVGLEIHENPRFSPSENNPVPACAVITVEPGIYLPKWGGVRIEDLVVVHSDGIRNLTGSPKQDLMELG